MRKLKLEKVAGIVALSYLVLIPVGGALVWMKLQTLDEDLSTIWEKLEIDPKLASRDRIKELKERVFQR